MQEIAKDAKFTVGGVSRFDVVQGELGDCWCARPLTVLYPLNAHTQTHSNHLGTHMSLHLPSIALRRHRLLAAIACLSMYEELFNHVVPKEDQEFDANYCGVCLHCTTLHCTLLLICILTRTTQLIRWCRCLPLPSVPLRQVGRRGGGRPAADSEREAHFPAVECRERVLVGAAREGLRQVRPQ